MTRQLAPSSTTSAPAIHANLGAAWCMRPNSRGSGASIRISNTIGVVKWRMLRSKWLSMHSPAKTASDTQSTRQRVAHSLGITGGQRKRFPAAATASATASRPRKPGVDLSASRTGK